ncbi:MAG: 2-phosphosulfolactate phosphatase [Clostridia bacterium]|nr:2-phosphosulfolactate phosphatase [Clostridia bacterium]
MRIRILELIEGAKQARGLTVIIDVLRAFSLECYLYDFGARLVRPVGRVEEGFALREAHPGSLLIGERQGKMIEGFDFGNTPGGIPPEAVKGRLIFHTTSAGTQGVVQATGASEIISGSLVNAAAVAAYIKAKQPEEVSLVCMGNGGVRRAEEDLLCAEYIRSLLEGCPLEDLRERIEALPTHGAEHFFNPATQDVFPEQDFWLCMQVDRFPFVLRMERDEIGLRSVREFVRNVEESIDQGRA